MGHLYFIMNEKTSTYNKKEIALLDKKIKKKLKHKEISCYKVNLKITSDALILSSSAFMKK